jgi:preprotein translocase subunit SecG
MRASSEGNQLINIINKSAFVGFFFCTQQGGEPMLKKWWFWLAIILFIAINLLVNDGAQQNDQEQKINQRDGEISTH